MQIIHIFDVDVLPIFQGISNEAAFWQERHHSAPTRLSIYIWKASTRHLCAKINIFCQSLYAAFIYQFEVEYSLTLSNDLLRIAREGTVKNLIWRICLEILSENLQHFFTTSYDLPLRCRVFLFIVQSGDIQKPCLTPWPCRRNNALIHFTYHQPSAVAFVDSPLSFPVDLPLFLHCSPERVDPPEKQV